MDVRDAGARRAHRGRWIAGALALLAVLVLVWAAVRGVGRDGSEAVTGAGGGSSQASDGGSGAEPTGTSTATVPSSSAPLPAQPTVVEPPSPGATGTVTKPPTTEDSGFDDTVVVDPALEVSVVSVEAVTAGQDIPGEKSGPAVEVVVEVVNRGDDEIDLSGASVSLTYDGDSRVPAPEVIGDSTQLLPAALGAGRSAQAVSTYSVPLATNGEIRIIVDILAARPDVVFVGPRPQ